MNGRYRVRSKAPTTLVFVCLNQSHASDAFYNENSAGRSLDAHHASNLSVGHTTSKALSALYFGGISLINNPATKAHCALALKYAANKVIVLDPNRRPNFISHEQNYAQRLGKMVEGGAELSKVLN